MKTNTTRKCKYTYYTTVRYQDQFGREEDISYYGDGNEMPNTDLAFQVAYQLRKAKNRIIKL